MLIIGCDYHPGFQQIALVDSDSGDFLEERLARRLAVRLYWMWRKQWDYEQWKKFGPHAGKLGTGVGVQ